MNLNVGQSKMLKMRYRKKQQCLRKVSKQKQAGPVRRSAYVTGASEVEEKKVNEIFKAF